MTNVLVFEDGELIENLKSEYLWYVLSSKKSRFNC